MKGIIIEQRDSVVREVLALYGINDPPLPTPPFNKAFTFIELPDYHAMVQIDAYHPDTADNGLTLIMLPSNICSKEQAEDFFESYNFLDAQGFLSENVSTRPLCPA